MKKFIVSLVMTVILILEAGFSSVAASSNDYTYLLMPTQITKINNTYFIVDANHNQVIYTDNLGNDIKDWNVMTRNVSGPHSIAGDADIYMVTDTESNRVLTFEKTYDGFRQLQVFDNVGVRPHYVSYNYSDGSFYVLSSMTGQMYIYKRVNNTKNVVLTEIKDIPYAKDCYIRSFTIAGNVILFPVIERSSIMMVDIDSFKVLGEYSVPYNLSGMAQISIIGNYFYLTVSTDINYSENSSTIVRAKNRTDFATGNYENLYGLFGNKGTPYFISAFDGAFYMIRENASPNVYRFNVTNDVISNVRGMFN
jgi:hypothetical protein